ncbi:hypothetical protein LOCC1_G000610 [Lachnellula occidentalis]|uniref:Uncharacterized protein n=1 Tax=Lachnellula occidentalis TaxID=215460 RepID=A0A8H8S9J8_9HELO|nr:hypothetical protein LOCC1_G000610 [Lachnellula occidentalis]
MEHHEGVTVAKLGPRTPGAAAVGMMDNVMEIAVPSRIVERTPPGGGGSGTDDSSSATTSTASSSSSTSTSCGTNSCEKGIGNSTYSLPIALGIVHVRQQRFEDANDRHASMDFGLGDVPQPGRPKRNKGPNMTEMDLDGEKGASHASQRSMDFNIVESPYLLPPEVQDSRESLHSMSRSTEADPYRPVTQYYPGDEKSIRSQSKNNGSSIYTASSMAPSRMHETSTAELLPNASSMPRSYPPRQNSLHQNNALPGFIDSQPPVPPYPSEPQQAHLPEPPTSPRLGQSLAPLSPAAGDDRASFASDNTGMRQSNNYLGAFINVEDETPAPLSISPETTRKSPPPMINTLPSNPRPQVLVDVDNEYGDGFMITPPSPGRDAEAMRGQRYSMDVPPEEFAQAGLGAPGFDPKRLSMGFRPLPPDAVTESDDPEIRANRIRSFYKEYFDDSKPEPSGGQYHEDYDENYMGEAAAYFDPDTNAFVMPYSQPVTRRAMTPPPRGRFAGPPRAMHGSMGGMSGPRGQQAPRAFSSASGRQPKKPMPPPQALNTLPTPSKLKDDSFGVVDILDFAPPQNYRDRVAGRSESPFGERRPYSPAVPVFTPTVSAFEELAPMPSPHMFRKSGTFTGLDFAPPKRIRDPDSMSDAGSIRSNNSGISKAQLGAIRGGAYRVSRIPKDAVFTKDDMAATLKPSWDMVR